MKYKIQTYAKIIRRKEYNTLATFLENDDNTVEFYKELLKYIAGNTDVINREKRGNK